MKYFSNLAKHLDVPNVQTGAKTGGVIVDIARNVEPDLKQCSQITMSTVPESLTAAIDNSRENKLHNWKIDRIWQMRSPWRPMR